MASLTQMTNIEVQNLLDLLDGNIERAADLMAATPHDTLAYDAARTGFYDMQNFRRRVLRELDIRGL